MFDALARRMGANNQSIGRYLIATMALGFALLVAVGIAAAWVSIRTRSHGDWVAHTYKVEVALGQAQVLIEQGEATRRGYLLAQQQIYLDAYQGFEAGLTPALADLARLTRDNPRQQRDLATYRRQIDALIAARRHTIALVKAGRSAEAVRFFAAEAAFRRTFAIRATVGRMLAEERRLLALRDADLRFSERAFYSVLAGAGVLLLALASLGTVTLLRFTRDLAVSRDELRDLNATLEDQVADRTADLSRANEEIQRFAYIVSHDLRSPLVNVMGFTSELEEAARPLAALIDRAEAEAPALLTEDAKLAVREDLPEAIGFIRTSTQKMDRLINAILKLSREGRRVVAAEPLDVAEIAETVAASMKQVIDARGATVEVQHPLPPLVSDRLGLEQILSNLIENATKYLHPGRAGHISVAGQRERDRVTISVTDNGRGIAPADHQRIFDLFRRSGAQDQPGEGIGLAHVRALAYRLGGTIDVESTLGEGSTFRLNLPAIFQGPRA